MGKAILIFFTCLLISSSLLAVLLGISSGLLDFVFQKILEKEINKVFTKSYDCHSNLCEFSLMDYKLEASWLV